MSRLVTLVLILHLMLTAAVSALAIEAVDNFTTEVVIQTDGSVDVQERIDYRTDVEKHGIYRYIPYSYNIDGLRYRVDISQLEVTDELLNPMLYSTSRSNGNLNLKIGDPDKTFSGDRVYLINYRMSDVVREFESEPELYWDSVGEGWQFPINRSQVVVRSPYARIVKTDCFVGEFGTQGTDCKQLVIDDFTVMFSHDQTLTYGDNFTVVVGLDPINQLALPSKFERQLKSVMDNAWLGLIPLPLITMLGLWYRRGRDWVFVSDNIFDQNPQKTKKLKPVWDHLRTPMVYQPLEDLSPAEAGVILDERVDNQDIIAEIIQLAHLGYLKIESTTQGKFFKRRDYLFTKVDKPQVKLLTHQRTLIAELFASGDSVKLSQLKGKFYQTMDKVKKQIYDELTSKKLFTTNPSNAKLTYALVAFVLIALCAGVAMFLNQFESPLPLFAVGWQTILTPFFAMAMVQKTAVGSNYFLQARGLRANLKTGAWRTKIQEKNLFIEEVLPFAVAFGVVDRLARDMKDLNLMPPQYAAAVAAASGNWYKDMNDFSKAAVGSLSHNPSSSSASGGSGFSGGSSGGGFGGGGGGSW